MKQPFPLLLLLIYFFLFILPAKAQTPAIEWQHLYGGPGGDYSFEIQPTNDGGFISVGSTEGDGGDVSGYHGNPNVDDLWLIKTDSKHNIQWQKCLGGTYMEYCIGSCLKQTPDGGYVIAATSGSKDYNVTGNNGGVDFWVIKLDDKGNVIWNKCYGGSKNDYASGIAIASDGSYVVAGEVESNDGDVSGNHGNRDGWVIKISDTGVLQWQEDLGGSNDDEFYDVAVDKQGNCILAGYTLSNDGDIKSNHGKWDFWVVKLNSNGNLLWNRTYGGSEADIASSLKATADGGCIVAGQTASDNGDVSGKHNPFVASTDYWLLKLSSTGSIDWQKCYGGVYNEIAFAVQLTPDGGYVVAGSAESPDGDVGCNSGVTDGYVVKVDSKGDIQWHKVFGGSYFDEAHSVQPLSDGGYLVAAYSCSTEINGYHPVTIPNSTCDDFWILKLSPPGLPVPPPSVQIDTSSAIVCGGSATLKASAKYAGIKYTYQWFRNGVDAGIQSSVYTASDFKDSDVVVCILTTGGPCEDVGPVEARDTIILKTNPVIQPAVSINASSTAVCNGTPINFTASVINGGRAPRYDWLVNNVSTGNTGGIFTSKTLQQGDEVKCIYADQNACITSGTITSNVIKVLGAEMVSSSVNITSSLNDICKGTKIVFKAETINAGVNPSFQWELNGVNAGSNTDSFSSASFNNNDIVSCTIKTDPLFTCAAGTTARSYDIIIHVIDKTAPSVNITAASTSICKGNPVTFTAVTSDGGQNPSFQWQVNGANTGSNSNIFTTSVLNDHDTITCFIKSDPLFTCITTPFAVSNNIVVTVTAGANPSVNLDASGNDVCFGTNITFNANVINGGSVPHYQWKLNGENIGSDKAVYNSNSLKNGDSLVCIVTAGIGSCSNAKVPSNVVYALINNLPSITVNPADTFITPGNSIRLNAIITGSIATFKWEPAGMLKDPLALSPLTVPLNDNQTYKLTVENEKGCSADKVVLIKMIYGINAPTAFTPNRDGRNDIFRVKYLFPVKEFHLIIYNRWGQPIFETKDITKGWDGSYKGLDASMDTYIWIISLTDTEGKKQGAQGTVTLIR